MGFPLYFSVLTYLIPAIIGHNNWIATCIFVLVPFATINHAKNHEEYKGKLIVRSADRILAHVYAILFSIEASKFFFSQACFYWFSLAYTCFIFYIIKPSKSLTLNRKRLAHASMHIVGAIGLTNLVLLIT